MVTTHFNDAVTEIKKSRSEVVDFKKWLEGVE